MSAIAAKNQQKELVDVNNLWKWPTEVGKLFNLTINEPDFWKWHPRCTVSGRCDDENADKICQFTDSSLAAKVNGYYAPGLFIDLAPGSYVFSFHCSKKCTIWKFPYIKLPSGEYSFGGISQNITFPEEGNHIWQLDIPDERIMFLRFNPGLGNFQRDMEPVVFTDIIVREGVL